MRHEPERLKKLTRGLTLIHTLDMPSTNVSLFQLDSCQ